MCPSASLLVLVPGDAVAGGITDVIRVNDALQFSPRPDSAFATDGERVASSDECRAQE